MKRSIVVDSNEKTRTRLVAVLSGMGHQADAFDCWTKACASLRCQHVDLIIMGWDFPDGPNGLELLAETRRSFPDASALLVSPHPDTGYAKRAMALGACHYMVAPFKDGELVSVVAAVLHDEEQDDSLIETMQTTFIGSSPNTRSLLRDLVKYVRDGDSSVLITGDTGTGKELCATLIHKLGPRATHPFVAQNCASIQSSISSSEIFGHKKGAFTGAELSHDGLFEAVGKGTLLLDEIEELSLEVQPKLLRVIETREYLRVGGSKPVCFEGRLIYASNCDLESAVTAKRFRQDLYYRVIRNQIRIPPLRERREDIPELVRHFIRKYAKGRSVAVPNWVFALLCEYDYPGNVRELDAFIKNAVERCHGDQILLKDLPSALIRSPAEASAHGIDRKELFALPQRVAVERLEQDYNREYLPRVLADCRNNLAEAARRAGIDKKTFVRKWKAAGLWDLSQR